MVYPSSEQRRIWYEGKACACSLIILIVINSGQTTSLAFAEQS